MLFPYTHIREGQRERESAREGVIYIVCMFDLMHTYRQREGERQRARERERKRERERRERARERARGRERARASERQSNISFACLI